MLTISILKQICRDNDIKGYSQLCKDDLLKLCKIIDKKPLYILPLEKSKVQIDNLKELYKQCFPNSNFKISKSKKYYIGVLYPSSNEAVSMVSIDTIKNIIWDVCISKSCRGKGYAGILMKEMIDMYHKKNKKLKLFVLKDNEHAIHVYKKLGFIINNNDTTYDYAYLMELKA